MDGELRMIFKALVNCGILVITANGSKFIEHTQRLKIFSQSI